MIRVVVQLLVMGGLAFFLFKAVKVADQSSFPLTMPDLRAAGSDTANTNDVAGLTQFQPVGAETLTHSLSAPIFFTSRKFGDETAKEVVPTKTGISADSLSLHGIVLQDDSRKAMVSAEGLPSAWYSAGELVGDWKILEIFENKLTLKRGAEKVTLLLYQEN